MTQALSLIDDAYLMIGLRGEGESLTAARAQYAFRRLNSMLGSWATRSLYAKKVSDVFATVPAGQTFTVGPTGDIVTVTVPVRLEMGGYARVSGDDTPITLVDRETYTGIAFKSISSQWPCVLFYEPGIEEGVCHVYPALSGSTEVHLQVLTPLAAFPDLTTEVALPLGYEEAILLSLAEKLCIGKMNVDAELAKQARAARDRIKTANVVVPNLRGYESSHEDIYTGWIA